jgi:predicted metal-binding protein
MPDVIKVGIIICDRYDTCSGGKCLRSLRERTGAFSRYKGLDVQLVGYTTCDGCPGGNVEYAPDEMKKNGAEVIHLATGLVVGYPPCPYIDHFCELIEKHYKLKVVIGTHPIPEKYFQTHRELGTWKSPDWQKKLEDLVDDQLVRLKYD